MTTNAMANPKTIHSITGDFKPVSGCGWKTDRCTWYGPGFYWNHTAAGPILLPPGKQYLRMWKKQPAKYAYFGAGVLRRNLPYNGTVWVQLVYKKVSIVVPVIDCGAINPSLQFDLTGGTKVYFDSHGARYDGCNLLKWRIVKKVKTK
jgi:hypothetical protein